MRPLHVLGIDPKYLHEAPIHTGTPENSDQREDVPLQSSEPRRT